MKKIFVIISILSLIIFSSCSKVDENVKKIKIIQIVEHEALDNVRKGFEDGLKEKSKEITFDIEYKNAQSDISLLNSIASSFADSKADLVFAISTPAAQATANIIRDIPIVFSAVSDPVGSNLIINLDEPESNITGITDFVDIKEQLSLFNKIDKNIKKVGILYNTSESNSIYQVEEAKKAAKELNLEIVDQGVNTINDLQQATDELIEKVDAVFFITDNTVSSSISTITQKLSANKKISIASDVALVKKGVLFAIGIDYYELGKMGADQAIDLLLNNKKVSEVKVLRPKMTLKYLNDKVADELGIDKNLEVFIDSEKL